MKLMHLAFFLKEHPTHLGAVVVGGRNCNVVVGIAAEIVHNWAVVVEHGQTGFVSFAHWMRTRFVGDFLDCTLHYTA